MQCWAYLPHEGLDPPFGAVVHKVFVCPFSLWPERWDVHEPSKFQWTNHPAERRLTQQSRCWGWRGRRWHIDLRSQSGKMKKKSCTYLEAAAHDANIILHQTRSVLLPDSVQLLPCTSPLNYQSREKLITFKPSMFRNVKALSRVDFPAPDAPMMASSSPGLT